MSAKLANNAWGTLASSILATDVSLTLTAGQGARFPSPSGTMVFYGTLVDSSNNLEIVKCTARTTDTLTIVRAQDGTTALPFTAGSRLEIRLTSVAWDAKMDADMTNVHAATSKASPVDSDELALWDSVTAGLNKLTIANLKALIFTAWGALIAAGTAKTTPVDADAFDIMDSAASNATKTLTMANLKAFLKTYFDTIYTTLANVLATANTWTKAQRGALVTLTDGATITPDFSLGNNFQCQLGGSRTLANPTNIVEGQSGLMRWIQDATGSRVLSYGWMYSTAGGTLPVLSTGAGYHDEIAYMVSHYATSTVTISIATPGVVTWTGHGLHEGDKIQFTTTGALPTGLTASTTYYVKYIDANTFQLAATRAGAAIATSGTQSGVHTAVSAEIRLTLAANVS